MEYKNPVSEEAVVKLVRYSPEYKERYKKMYNECYHEMREALRIEPYDFIQDDSFFNEGMDDVYLLLEGEDIIGSVALKGSEIDDLLVEKRFQGKGYGKQILLWALQNINANEIILHVAEWNQKAVNLYKKTGFEVVEVEG